MTSLTPIGGGGSLAPLENSPFEAMKGLGRRIEYLRGKEHVIGGSLKWGLVGLAAFFVVRNIGKIESFFDQLASTMETLIYCGILGAIIWVLWTILSSERFQYTISMMIDIGIEKFHKMAVARDKFAAAEFSIRRFTKRQQESDESRANVLGAYQAVNQAAGKAEDIAKEAAKHAKGFYDEIQRRKAGEEAKLRLTDEQLQRSFAQAKSRLRVNYEHFQRQSERAEMLRRRAMMLNEVSDVMQAKLEELRERLRLAREDFELALRSMEAMQGSDDLVNSPEARTYEEALDGIRADTDFMNGRVIMLMERLDPLVQHHRMMTAAGEIDDAALFEAFLEESNTTVKPEVKERLLTAPQAPEIPDIERLLGGMPKRAEAKVPRSSSAETNQFNKLLE